MVRVAVESTVRVPFTRDMREDLVSMIEANPKIEPNQMFMLLRANYDPSYRIENTHLAQWIWPKPLPVPTDDDEEMMRVMRMNEEHDKEFVRVVRDAIRTLKRNHRHRKKKKFLERVDESERNTFGTDVLLAKSVIKLYVGCEYNYVMHIHA